MTERCAAEAVHSACVAERQWTRDNRDMESPALFMA